VGYAAFEANPREIAAIRAACKRVRKAANAGLLHETLESKSEFQFAIFQAAKTPVLIRFVETLRMQIEPHCTAAMQRCLTDQHPFLARTLINDNAIVEAIATQDAELARQTKRRDIQELREFVEEVTPR
jgi:DNA-binding GntR family transcriptional regulator